MPHRPGRASAGNGFKSSLKPLDADLPIAFIGTYPPRRCGIATFTRDLSAAIGTASDRVLPMVIAVSDPAGQYEYPPEVKYEIRQGAKGDYARAAEFINYSDVRLVSIQHEHGIFGGDDGAYILDLLSALRTPALATLHTVLKRPSDSQKAVIQRMAHQCVRLVVMSKVAADLLGSSYGVSEEKIQVIPHGIPQMPPRDQKRLKAKFGVSGQQMLLTFGLLGPNKGIETVIRALPAVIAQFPKVMYFIVGATHPTIARRHGEAYRTSLEREAERLGVREHVVFRDQFVSNEELYSYLQATDLYVSPYLNQAQVTSGALSYAMGAGAAVVSTPYWHAEEMLSDGRGILFPFGDHGALSVALVSLLGSPAKRDQLRSAASEFTRSMVWPRIGKAYLDLGTRVVSEVPTRLAPIKPERASSLPELRLDHLIRMTDDTGVIQHATFSVPARSTGYCVDDNARALIVALHADRVSSDSQTRRLVTTYLSYLHCAQAETGDFKNLMSYDRQLGSGPGSEDCLGRAIWALGSTVELAAEEGCGRLAKDMFNRALPRAMGLGPRGTALSMLGLASFIAVEPSDNGARNSLSVMADKLVKRYQEESVQDWRWFEPALTYDNAIIPLALFKAFSLTRERASLRVARESLEFLEDVCFVDGCLTLVGNAGWHSRGGQKPHADEQAIDAAAFVLAFRGAYLATGDHHYLRRMRESFAWFLGSNRLGMPLYDSVTAGCRDGLGAVQANQNQGAESTICFLLSLLEMLELAGEGLEHAADIEEAKG
ncbi:MAG: glycosyl transferase [Candidatus Omnitrophica bacterium CG11_big_fil_rev_8_21_14_0_20_63_9]|nr:MAG: glycosyl transferase [Candidatus Omnitrophica bacterium CG11_big_fil_rev_8_21_14_0_20_63_9]